MVGDGYCHDEANNLECGFDGGDCCYSCTSKLKCKDCICLTGNIWQDKNDLFIGNGYCNDEYNNDACNFDGGDCCKNVNSLVGDGFCNDETNFEACNYDGDDCCKLPVNIDLCSNCECSKLKPFYDFFVVYSKMCFG